MRKLSQYDKQAYLVLLGDKIFCYSMSSIRRFRNYWRAKERDSR